MTVGLVKTVLELRWQFYQLI